MKEGEARGEKRGRLEGERRLILIFGEQHFGRRAPAGVRAAIEAIDNVERLEELSRRISSVQSWKDLFAHDEPTYKARRSPRKRS